MFSAAIVPSRGTWPTRRMFALVAAFSHLYDTARDARRVVLQLGDRIADARVSHWLRLFDEHGSLLGWLAPDDAIDNDAHEEASCSTDLGSSIEGGSNSGGSCSGVGGCGAGVAEGVPVQDDRNFDICGACGLEGLLLCCDNCPQAYHAEVHRGVSSFA